MLKNYKEVENFEDDEMYEDEVEEVYVTLDLSAVDPALVSGSSTFRLIGLETDTPYLQLSDSVFKGRHEKLLGTEIIFSGPDEDGSDSNGELRHVANSENRIRFREVQLKKKSQEEDNTQKQCDSGGTSENLIDSPENVDFVSRLLNSQSNTRRRGPYKPRKVDVASETQDDMTTSGMMEVDQDAVQENTLTTIEGVEITEEP